MELRPLAKLRVVAISSVSQNGSRGDLSVQGGANLLQGKFRLGLKTDFRRYARGGSPLLVLGPYFW
jgi:hypothetical protein